MPGTQGQTGPESYWGRGKQTSTIVVTTEQSTPTMKPEFQVVATRINPTLEIRKKQIEINLLGVESGPRYIAARLSRFPGELEQLFKTGLTTKTGQIITPRIEQAHVIPYLTRVCDKLNQYIFGRAIERTGADEKVTQDINRAGMSIDAFMREVSKLITAVRWCWIGIDAPFIEPGTTLTVADQEKMNIRAYWNLYTPLQVVDWQYAADGALDWVLTETEIAETGAATVATKIRKNRWLWERGQLSRYVYDDNGKNIIAKETMPLPWTVVPFVCCGVISDKPHLFDSLEGINRTIMDLNSCSRQNFFETVFPLRYLPEGAFQWLKENNQNQDIPEGAAGALGLHYAISVAKDDHIPGVLTPNGADLAAVRGECNALRDEFFEIVGLMLRTESRQMQSGEAKAWDFLDAEQAIRERARVLEECEQKATDLTKLVDATWKPWAAKYPEEFSVRDFAAELQALIMVKNIGLPLELDKLATRKVLDALVHLGPKSTPEEIKLALESIEAMEEQTVPEPFALSKEGSTDVEDEGDDV